MLGHMSLLILAMLIISSTKLPPSACARIAKGTSVTGVSGNAIYAVTAHAMIAMTAIVTELSAPTAMSASSVEIVSAMIVRKTIARANSATTAMSARYAVSVFAAMTLMIQDVRELYAKNVMSACYAETAFAARWRYAPARFASAAVNVMSVATVYVVRKMAV